MLDCSWYNVVMYDNDFTTAVSTIMLFVHDMIVIIQMIIIQIMPYKNTEPAKNVIL